MSLRTITQELNESTHISLHISRYSGPYYVVTEKTAHDPVRIYHFVVSINSIIIVKVTDAPKMLWVYFEKALTLDAGL